MLNRNEIRPKLKRRVDKFGNQVIDVTFDQSSVSAEVPHVLQIRLYRIIHNQGHQVDAWGHSSGPVTTSIKRFALVQEDLALSTMTSTNDMNELATNEFLTINSRSSTDQNRKLSIVLTNKYTEVPYEQVAFDTMSRHVYIVGSTDSIHVQIVKEQTKPTSKGDRLKRMANRTLDSCKSYLTQESKGSSLILQKRTFRRDITKNTWSEKGRSISSSAQGESEDSFVSTLSDCPPPPYLA
ncbi:uncharacterized protein FA14DRAFT_160051 [Meira miltonrushii]|uniref:Uncharacterized protein n=1 Tax=Meira miltonrushii TaxID=1280837 RepID=A0A316VMR4_9BASI|nr:uncharacterized protein FA14DRAFT_160051 [Meira miltonrushii]PWN38584.1 hypothetical protein FA14DRAFT_160051 [Meira miltonrushii]